MRPRTFALLTNKKKVKKGKVIIDSTTTLTLNAAKQAEELKKARKHEYNQRYRKRLKQREAYKRRKLKVRRLNRVGPRTARDAAHYAVLASAKGNRSLKGYDYINPPHYSAGHPLEVINIVEHYNLNFSIGNAVKYLLRLDKKPGANRNAELKKARWYIDHELTKGGEKVGKEEA